MKYIFNNDYSHYSNKNYYANYTELLIKPKEYLSYIPNVIYITYYDLDFIPDYVKNNINKYCEGYDVKIYDDSMCIDFLDMYYGKDAVSIFNNMENGAHKADFWRYCILYLFGGYYFDIKTDFQKNIREIFDDKNSKTWYTVLSTHKGQIFNGIIVTPPGNPVLLKAINNIYDNPKPPKYEYYIEKLFDIISENCGKKLSVGNNIQKNDWNCILFQEECNFNCKIDCDKYGYKCVIKNENDQIIFNTRYNDFPWKKQIKTYVSMTTIPERLKNEWFFNNLKRSLSILKNNQILILNIPDISLKGEKYIIPDNLKSLESTNFIINHCGKDEGPITKVLPSLRYDKIKDNDNIIVCDDDIVYKEKVFDFLEESVNKNPEKVSQMCSDNIFGFQSFAFKKKVLKDILDIKIPESCIRIDDDVINSYVTNRKISIVKVSYENNDIGFSCSFNQKDTDTHPNWKELNKEDDRPPMVKQCLNDINFGN